MSSFTESFAERAKREITSVAHGVRVVSESMEQDVLCLRVAMDTFSMDTLEAIIDAQWTLMECAADRYLHVTVVEA